MSFVEISFKIYIPRRNVLNSHLFVFFITINQEGVIHKDKCCFDYNSGIVSARVVNKNLFQ